MTSAYLNYALDDYHKDVKELINKCSCSLGTIEHISHLVNIAKLRGSDEHLAFLETIKNNCEEVIDDINNTINEMKDKYV